MGEEVVSIMELQTWHFQTIKTYYNFLFGKTFTEANIVGKGTIHQQEAFYEINKYGSAEEWNPANPKDTFYIKIKKGDKQYVLPKRFLKDMPFLITKQKPIRLKTSDTVVWNYVQKVNSLYVPEKRLCNYRSFVDAWNPVEHTTPDTFTMLKLIAFSHTHGLKMGVCADTGAGKNANMTLLKSFIGRTAPKVKSPSKAAFWQILSFNDRINIDEITSWSKTDVTIIEDMLVDIADDSPDTDKHSLGSNGQIATTDLMKKGLTFTFNPKSKRNPNTFESRFNNADKILDRYPIIYLKGKVTSSVPKPSLGKAESLVVENLPTLKAWSANSQYFVNQIDNEQHGYDRTNNPFKGNARHLSNTKSLIDHIDAYSLDQAEFDKWMEFLRVSQNRFHSNTEEKITVEEERV